MANAKTPAQVLADNDMCVPEMFWKEGEPHPSWVESPLIYTSPDVAQAFLDRLDQRRAFDELRDLDEELDALPQHGEPGEQLLLVDIPIRRYTKCFV